MVHQCLELIEPNLKLKKKSGTSSFKEFNVNLDKVETLHSNKRPMRSDAKYLGLASHVHIRRCGYVLHNNAGRRAVNAATPGA